VAVRSNTRTQSLSNNFAYGASALDLNPNRPVLLDDLDTDENLVFIEGGDLAPRRVNIHGCAHDQKTSRTSANELNVPPTFLMAQARIADRVAVDEHVQNALRDEFLVLPHA